MEDIFIATYQNECGIANSLDKSLKELEDVLTSSPNVSEITFYKAKKLVVTQKLIIDDTKDVD